MDESIMLREGRKWTLHPLTRSGSICGLSCLCLIQNRDGYDLVVFVFPHPEQY
jgi:hypothetical protein